jgi:hypothetical protein
MIDIICEIILTVALTCTMIALIAWIIKDMKGDSK